MNLITKINQSRKLLSQEISIIEVWQSPKKAFTHDTGSLVNGKIPNQS